MGPGEGLERIGLVGEAGHVRPVPGDQAGPGGVREERTAGVPGPEQPVPGRAQPSLQLRAAGLGVPGGGEGGQHPGGLNGVAGTSVRVQRGRPGQGVGQLGVTGLGGGPGDQRRVAQVGHLRQPLYQQAGELLGAVAAEHRPLAGLRQVAGAEHGDRGVPGAGAAPLQPPGAVRGPAAGQGEGEGLVLRPVHRRKTGLGDGQQPGRERVERQVVAGERLHSCGGHQTFTEVVDMTEPDTCAPGARTVGRVGSVGEEGLREGRSVAGMPQRCTTASGSAAGTAERWRSDPVSPPVPLPPVSPDGYNPPAATAGCARPWCRSGQLSVAVPSVKRTDTR